MTATLMEAGTLKVELDGNVAVITLTREELHNRFDEDLHVDLIDALATVRQREEARAGVLASTGPVFSAGGDFDFMRKAHDDPQFLSRHVDVGRALLLAFVDLPIPIVAAVQGPAIGLGATVALACDCVVASRNAVFADPHVQIGLAAGDGGCLVWPEALGTLRARRYLLTGDRLGAEDAYLFGAVTDLVDEPSAVTAAATSLAGRMAALPPLAVQGTKRALASVMRQRADEVVDLAFAYEARSVNSDDLLEAIDAFRQRRPGTYVGR
jgi:enoyl-CoA hydratase